jgi:hypothetical protein
MPIINNNHINNNINVSINQKNQITSLLQSNNFIPQTITSGNSFNNIIFNNNNNIFNNNINNINNNNIGYNILHSGANSKHLIDDIDEEFLP